MNETTVLSGDLGEILKARGFAFKPNFDGVLDRFDRNGKSGSAWAVGKILASAGTPMSVLMFGDFATGEKYEWWSRKAVSKEEAKALASQAQEERKKYAKAKEERQREARIECQTIWEDIKNESSLPTAYSGRKGLFDLYGARRQREDLLVPIHSADGTLWNLQRIEADGTKRFYPGGRITGNVFFVNGYPSQAPRTIYLCEGYATGASIFEALRSRPSAPLHSETDTNTSTTGNKTSSNAFGSGTAFDRHHSEYSLPGSGSVARDPANYSAEDGGISPPPRADGQGDTGHRPAHRSGSQRGRHSEHRDTLAAELLATLTTSFDQRLKDAGAGLGGAQGLPALKGQEGGESSDQSNQRQRGTPRSPIGCGAQRARSDARHNIDRLRGQDGSPDGGLREGQDERGAHQGGSTALPSGIGATSFTVCCALNAGNLISAARALRKSWPGAQFILCADNDHQTLVQGRPYNPGVAASIDAAREVEGSVVLPLSIDGKFTHGVTDFNDLALLPNGADIVLARMAHPYGIDGADAWFVRHINARLNEQKSPTPPQTLTMAEPGEGESLVSFNRRGDPEFPTPQVVADHILRLYEGHLVVQDKDIFRFTGTHWKRLDQRGLDDLSMLIQGLCAKQCSPGQIDVYIEMLRRAAPAVPEGRNIFVPDPYSANFLNGTLRLLPNCTKYYLEFGPHRSEDYLINVLPYEYAPSEELPINTNFEEMLQRVFEGDADIAEKRRAVAQMFGACLIPTSPHLFMLFGGAGTGKSTIIKLAARLMHEDNVCSVDPTEFSGFNMETMAGKLVNYDTDICISRPINDALIKKIEDRVPLRIARKFQTDLRVPLPAIHIFGGNSIPPTLEGASRAHSRRWTFIKFDRSVAIGRFDKMFAENVFKSCPLGVLRFALEGLKDLIDSEGHFVQPTSGAQAGEEWQLMNDPVGEFIESMEHGEVLDNNTIVIKSKEGRLERTKLYELFKKFQQDSAPERRVMSRMSFYQKLSAIGFGMKIVNGTRFIEGFDVEARTGAQY